MLLFPKYKSFIAKKSLQLASGNTFAGGSKPSRGRVDSLFGYRPAASTNVYAQIQQTKDTNWNQFRNKFDANA